MSVELDHERRLSVVETQAAIIPALMEKQDETIACVLEVRAIVSNGLTVKVTETVRKQMIMWGGGADWISDVFADCFQHQLVRIGRMK